MDSTKFREVYNNPALREMLAASNMAHVLRCVSQLSGPGLHALEIGCYTGGMTGFMLAHGIAKVDVIDTFLGSPEHGEGEKHLIEKFIANMDGQVGPEWRSRVLVHIGRSADMLARMILDNRYLDKYDLVYVDARHDSRDVVVDSVLAWKLLRAGGVMIWDDYEWVYYEDPYRNPRPAIDFFLAAFAPNLQLLEKHYQLSVRKVS